MTLHHLIREDSAFLPNGPASQHRAKTNRDANPVLAKRPTSPAGHELQVMHDALLRNALVALASSLDYGAVLGKVSRTVSEALCVACILSVIEKESVARFERRPLRGKSLTEETLAALVADVVAHGSGVIATRVGALASLALSPNARHRAEMARREAGAEWALCVPILAEGTGALGAVTLFGSSKSSAAPNAFAHELGRHLALAIRNGRLYFAALKAAKERQRVLSLVAHELKSPLGVILLGTAHALERMNACDSRECHVKELEVVLRSAERIKKLVLDLLDVSSIDAGKLCVRPTFCDVAETIESVLRDLEPVARREGVTLVYERNGDAPRAWVDADRLAQVLVNLVANAIRFTPHHGHVRLRVANVDATEVVFAVEDCGRGIEAGDLERVFDRFWQATDIEAMGSGLGLSICRSIVDVSGGRIWARSTRGVGTTIYFTLPKTPQDA